jgi:uncharacterized phage protein gp47/JayE
VVVLTIASADGLIDSTEPIIPNLLGSIAKTSESGVNVFIKAYTPINFKLNAVVQIAQGYQTALVQPAIEAALRSTFSFAARSFGQPVYQSEVIAAIQDVPGVVDVVLTEMYNSSDPGPSLQTQLAATVPQTGGRGQIVAAQLLTLDPGPLGLTVTPVTP